MPPQDDLQSRLATLSVGLEANTRHEQSELLKLEKLLMHSRVDEAALLTPRELSVERGSLFSPENLPVDRRLRWQAIVVKCLAGIALLVSSAACFDILMSGTKMLPLH